MASASRSVRMATAFAVHGQDDGTNGRMSQRATCQVAAVGQKSVHIKIAGLGMVNDEGGSGLFWLDHPVFGECTPYT